MPQLVHGVGGPRASDSGSQLERGLSEQRSSLTLQRTPSSPSTASDSVKPKVKVMLYSICTYIAVHFIAWQMLLHVCSVAAFPA